MKERSKPVVWRAEELEKSMRVQCVGRDALGYDLRNEGLEYKRRLGDCSE